MLPEKKQAIGLVGLGVMGRGVAENLIKNGYQVIGRDVSADALKWIESIGGVASCEASDVTSVCDVVISFVVNDVQTEALLFGENGLAKTMRPDTVFIACSTMAPKFLRELSVRLAKIGVHLMDAPVTGGQVGAKNATMTIMAAGPTAIYERIQPILKSIGGKIFFLGTEAGMGAQMKVVNQLLCGVHIAAAAEALAMAKKHGLPLDTTLEILKSGAASSWMLGDRGPRMIADSFDDVQSAVDIFVKDLGLVLDSAKQASFAAPMAHTAFLQFLESSGHGLGKLDDAAVIRNYTE